MLCYVTPKEHLGLPDARRQGRRHRLQDRRARRRLAKGHPERRSGTTRSQGALRFRWHDQFNLASIPTPRANTTTRRCRRKPASWRISAPCGARILLDEITQDVRDYAATLNDQQQGMAQMSQKFLGTSAQNVYVDAEKVKESNKAL